MRDMEQAIMCAISLYHSLYRRNLGRNDYRSLWMVRMARELIATHRRDCP